MDEVDDGPFLGTLNDAGTARPLRGKDVPAVVSLTHGPPAVPDAADVEVVRVPMTNGRRNEATSFREAVDATRRRLAAGERVLVHCPAGASRSPAVATVVALRRGVDLQAAFEQVPDRRPETDSHESPVRRAATVYMEATRYCV